MGQYTIFLNGACGGPVTTDWRRHWWRREGVQPQERQAMSGTNRVGILLLVAAAAVGVNPAPPGGDSDWRDVISGGGIRLSSNPANYWNQPQATRLPNGSWVVVLTQADITEGEPNQAR